jgi:hypothetical protein
MTEYKDRGRSGPLEQSGPDHLRPQSPRIGAAIPTANCDFRLATLNYFGSLTSGRRVSASAHAK